MTERNTIINAILDRAKLTKRKVFGFSSEKASCAQLGTGKKEKVPPEWNRMCVEGDDRWTYLPSFEDES